MLVQGFGPYLKTSADLTRHIAPCSRYGALGGDLTFGQLHSQPLRSPSSFMTMPEEF